MKDFFNALILFVCFFCLYKLFTRKVELDKVKIILIYCNNKADTINIKCHKDMLRIQTYQEAVPILTDEHNIRILNVCNYKILN